MQIFILIARKFNVRKLIQLLVVFFAFLGVLFELHISIIQEIYSSFGEFDGKAFVQFRIIFGAALVMMTALNILINQWRLINVRDFRVYIFFILYIFGIVWLNRDENGLMNTDATTALEFWTPILFKYLVFFCIGYNLLQTLSYRSLYLFFTLLAFIVVLTHVNFDTLTIDIASYIDSANTGNYLFLGDAMAICCLIVLACYKRTSFRVIFTAASLVVIFLIGSRTSFAVFSGACLLYFVLLFRARYLPVVTIAAISFMLLIQQVDFEELEQKNKRMTSIFIDYSEDSSVVVRKQFAVIGWEDIANNPILGNFGGQRDVFSFQGEHLWLSYMHNVFSYWRQFGIVAMLCLCYFLFSYIQILRKNLTNKLSPNYAATFLIGVFIITETTISRSFAFSNAHMVFGLIAWYSFLQIPRKAVATERMSDHSGLRMETSPKSRRRKRRRTKHKL